MPQIEKESKKFLWLRRYPDDSRYSLLDYFQRRVNEYCQAQGITSAKQKKLWEVIVRGTFYEQDNSIIFAELEHYNKARGLFSENPDLIVFDEAIPTLLDWKNCYLPNEPEKFKDLWKSTWRNKEKPKPTVLHLANAYDRTYHRLADFDQEIDKIANQELWKDDKIPKGSDFWYWEKDLAVMDTDTQKLVKKKLVFYRKKGDLEGWPVFFTKKGDLNVRAIKETNLKPLEVYNNKYLLSSVGKNDTLYFDYYSPTKKKLVDYHFDQQTFFLTPANKWKELLNPQAVRSKKKEWTEWINLKVLFFRNFEIRNEIIELLSGK